MPRFRLILTPAGCAVFGIALFILIRSLVNRNAYEIVLSCGILLLLLVFGIIGGWKSQKLKAMEPTWKTPHPMTANTNDVLANEETQVTGLESSLPLFFRLHFLVRGRFSPCNEKDSCSVFVETSVPRGETSAYLPLDFPMSGTFQGDGYCRLRDIFGLFSFSCGTAHNRTIKVRSAPCFGKEIHINAQSGAEDRRSKPSADEERYYMREYTPGDRFRDINWKSSDKIDTLITRISMDNQEKINRIEVHFRNYISENLKDKNGKITLEALWLLDRTKARLAYFLRSLMELNSSFIFDVHTAQNNWEIENKDDLEAFLEELACITFLPPLNETLQTGVGDMYVFSTACDVGLPTFLLANSQRAVNLFIVQPEDLTKRSRDSQLKNTAAVSKKSDTEIENLRFSNFTFKGCNPPLRWFLGTKIKPLAVQ
ncbi:MAG: DUF58 domain-containing protein, partial [Treponema sp.]|nr:DUF58 domain-containing protein [Treponema sp.]